MLSWSRVATWWTALRPRWLLLGGWFVFLLYAFPGYVMTEGADQLVDSRVGTFTDWHPVMMTEVWRLVGHVLAGPPGMLLAQSALLLFGTFVIARRFVSDRNAAFVAIVVLLVPPIMTTMAVICAEAQLVAWLVAGTALLVAERRRLRLLGLLALVIACGMNGATTLAVLPLIAVLFRWRDEQPRWQRIAIAIAAWLAVVLVSAGVQRVLVDARSEREQTRLAMLDVIGTLRYAPVVSDARAHELLGDVRLASDTGIQQRAKGVYGKDLFYAAGDQRVFEPTDTDDQRDALYAAHRRVIRALPGPYLTHRWRQLLKLVGIATAKTWTPVYTEFAEHERDIESMRHTGHHSAIQGVLVAAMHALEDTPLFMPLVYLVLALGLLVFAILRRERLCIVLLASGLAYEVGEMFLSTRTEYRDSLWLIAATLLAGIVLLAQRLQPRHERVGGEAAVLVARNDDLQPDEQRLQPR